MYSLFKKTSKNLACNVTKFYIQKIYIIWKISISKILNYQVKKWNSNFSKVLTFLAPGSDGVGFLPSQSSSHPEMDCC